jgi:hypothetical protein
MPQGEDKADWEAVEFSVMLPNINLLYLFCSVLILADRQYMGRFWWVPRGPHLALHGPRPPPGTRG